MLSDFLAPYCADRKITIFAQRGLSHANGSTSRRWEFARKITEAGFMVITGCRRRYHAGRS